MRIRIQKTVEIRDVETWRIVSPPKDPSIQWKSGRSAKELARFATDPSFEDFIRWVLNYSGVKEQDFICEPEAETYFERQGSETIDLGRSGPRNHDLLMVGETCVIGIEAKVSEKFGNYTVRQEWDRTTSENKRKKRIPGLIQFLSNGKYKGYEDSPDSVKSLQYQLLTATVGTVLEAIRRGKKEAIVLVLVFTGDVDKEDDYEQNVANNDVAFNAFVHEFFVNGTAIIQNVKCRIIEKKVDIQSYYRFIDLHHRDLF